MLGFIKKWFITPPNPIGIDFGSDHLRLAQVQFDGGEPKLLAAASTDVPPFARGDFDSRLDFFSQAIGELLARGRFKGRRCVLSLPASMMYIEHLRLPKLPAKDLPAAIRTHARGRLPIDPAGALIRHIVAGEVASTGLIETIVLATPRDIVDKYLAACARAKLDVVGMAVEPMALVDCFGHVHRRKIDADVVSMYVDLGADSTRVTIAHGVDILFCRAVDIGGCDYDLAVSDAMTVSLDDARLLRLKLAVAAPGHADSRDQRNVSPVVEPPIDHSLAPVHIACDGMTTLLIQQLERCRKDHRNTFPGRPVQRLIFVGGEARQRALCLRIAKEMNLTAQIGDPLVRMARTGEIPIESGIDRRLPQPAWAVVIGLSLGTPPREFVASPSDQASNNREGQSTVFAPGQSDFALKGAA